jgi:hypothetical protein
MQQVAHHKQPKGTSIMAREIKFDDIKGYLTANNARAAVFREFGNSQEDNLDYLIIQNASGRYVPVFLGERAVQKQVFARGPNFCMAN